ncbi:unnamed protein product [Spirodela intermedia]|uniref:LIM zinc-binding domain-containing protein n=1 Tax=Spirodela intermedia TaxID=51605 RepID=A0A7I8JB99_SPIIN|nr:unnamed protein product [Spirodela intermedia]CAA6667478.1 unnamed protein product [Spirodela intermedia]
MGWLNKIFKSSSHKISEGQYQGKYREEEIWDDHSTPPASKSYYDNDDIDHAIALSLSEEEQRKAKAVDTGSLLEDDEQLARALQESLNVESPPRENGHNYQLIPFIFSSGTRVCAGCNAGIGHGRFLSCMGAVWHPECFCCHSCGRPYLITSRSDRVQGTPILAAEVLPFHEHDGTPRCCSCERMEPRDTTYVSLDDGRKLCLECLDSAIMDNSECHPLFIDIQEFFEGLNMKVTQQIPLLLVERQALNEAMEGEKNGGQHHHLPETRGLCLSEEQTVSTILRRPRIGAGNRVMDMIREPYRLTRVCEVTAILILYGLPRLLTGSILAHEMMHAWLRLNGYRTLSQEVEEGICQVLAHMWLESEIVSGSGAPVVATSASPSPSLASSSSSSGLPKKAARSQFEKKFGEFFKHQIETDPSPAYGDGFRAGYQAVLKYGLRSTLDHIKLTGSFPC